MHKVNRVNVDYCNPRTSFVAEKTEAWGNWETLWFFFFFRQRKSDSHLSFSDFNFFFHLFLLVGG